MLLKGNRINKAVVGDGVVFVVIIQNLMSIH